jgi:hypothetical protein
MEGDSSTHFFEKGSITFLCHCKTYNDNDESLKVVQSTLRTSATSALVLCHVTLT